ncbi:MULTISPECIES: hypothetical protein [Pantoea]|uniref:hypothetical protein n=1 Tax=Pantoea TaxID=53335 RepID=UPI0013144805|nr:MULTISPECIES: hypothetical protein [Pantoea]MBZ6386980.1 hypothetical protein [Pantoea piersonii]MBZ6400280.1 hypothetical protein [Pantoea piersonii]MBZ6408333.1 hypothetical protein [Pantoea piersonii]MBZ6426560.1 hypothetical protein [Pantoea piersonii]NYB04272.1 hypothetical protein [Pantoea piersonii]
MSQPNRNPTTKKPASSFRIETPGGETMKGEVMERIIVPGKVTATIVDDDNKFRPTI